eukprot:SAG22_NODE_123_length_18914_cov_28.993410_10_plen_272_part_00
MLQREHSVESLREELESQQSSLTVWADKEREAALSALQDDLGRGREALGSCKDALTVSETVCRDQARSITDLKAEAKGLKEEVERLQADVEKKAAALEDEQALTSDLRAQAAEKANECSEAEAEIEQLRRELDRTAEEAEGYLGSLRGKESALKFVEGEVEQLKAMFDSKEQRLRDELQRQVDAAGELRQDLDSVGAVHADEVERLRKAHAEQLADAVKKLELAAHKSVAAERRVLEVEAEMRRLLQETVLQRQKYARLNKVFAEISAGTG